IRTVSTRGSSTVAVTMAALSLIDSAAPRPRVGAMWLANAAMLAAVLSMRRDHLLAVPDASYHIKDVSRRRRSSARARHDHRCLIYWLPQLRSRTVVTSIPLTNWLLAKVCPGARFSCTPCALIVVGRSTVQDPLGPRWKSPQAIGPSEPERRWAIPGCAVTQPKKSIAAAAAGDEPIFLSRNIELTSSSNVPATRREQSRPALIEATPVIARFSVLWSRLDEGGRSCRVSPVRSHRRAPFFCS